MRVAAAGEGSGRGGARCSRRDEAEQRVHLGAQPAQRLALSREPGLCRGTARTRPVRLECVPHRFGRAQPRYLSQEYIHRTAGDQLDTAVDIHDRPVARRGVVQGCRSVVGDECVGGDEDGRPFLVRPGEHHSRIEGGGQSFGQLVAAEQTPLVGVHDQGQLVLVAGQMSCQLRRQIRPLTQQAFRSPRRGESDQGARPGAQRRPVAVAEGPRGEDALQGGVTDDLRPRGGLRACIGQSGDLVGVGECVQGGGCVVGRHQVLRIQSGGR